MAGRVLSKVRGTGNPPLLNNLDSALFRIVYGYSHSVKSNRTRKGVI